MAKKYSKAHRKKMGQQIQNQKIKKKQKAERLIQKRLEEETKHKAFIKRVVAIILIVVSCIGVIIASSVTSNNSVKNTNVVGVPTLMDLGSHGCIPCDNLQPILSELSSKYKGKINVQFYDVNNSNKGRELGQKYGVTTIPTLIFLDKTGKEVKRMVGFQSKEVLENQFRTLGWIT